ncbi:hypothetical protein SISNIDRAFT_487378 [Sistotremastrum niveocremeum HHB9708]|uniref:F-box domain-containing protein n=1 Tax=Sistotremastrum niveocremeum HHB9708 TaxID=1314777 RepID=A0A164SE77_9AGAM|nr:hypothetical protein SISNIDRAFT_487378 [Sistotremastrum niveocremeum HHB9708]
MPMHAAPAYQAAWKPLPRASHRHLKFETRRKKNTFVAIVTHFFGPIMMAGQPSPGDNATPSSNHRVTPLNHVEVSEDSQIRNNDPHTTASNRAQNLQIPIHTLPDEILLQILSITVDLIEGEPPSNQLEIFNWRYLTSVCSRWREIMIDTASFWTTICIDWPPSLLNLFDARTKHAPLNIITKRAIISESSTGETARRLIITNSSRIRHLSVTCWVPTFDNSGSVASFMGQEIGDILFPQLTHAKFTDCGRISTLTHRPIFRLNAPRLRELKLDGVILQPTHLANMIHLTTLTVRDVSLGAREITLALESCPHLEYFEIENYVLPSPSRSSLDSHPISLPRMKQLIIRNVNWDDIISIVQRAKAPSSTHISLGISNGDVGNRSGDFEAKIAGLLRPRLQFYDRAELGVGYLRLYSHAETANSIVIQFWDWTADPDTSALLLSYFSEARTEHFTTVRMYGTHRNELPNTNSLFSTFSKWQNLSYLSMVLCGQLSNFFAAFRTDVILCPRLRRLDITHSRFYPLELMEFLQDRQSRAIRIEYLTIDTRGEDEMEYKYEEYVGKLIEIPAEVHVPRGVDEVLDDP